MTVPSESAAVEKHAGPHLVMLVDNPIIGDSRVQKQALAMQERGWRVTLVGRRLSANDLKRGTLGQVETRFAFVAIRSGAAPAAERSTLLRSPLAYATLRRQRSADGLADAAVADARLRIDALKLAGRDTLHRRYLARGRMLAAQVRRKVVDRRLTSSQDLRTKRQRATGRVDRMVARLWMLALRDNAWKRLDPGTWDWESAYGPVVDRLKPDLIHANDHRMLHVAVRAKLRAAGSGRTVKVVWDAHEWLEGLEVAATTSANWLPAQVRVERSFSGYADSVVTVSEVLADIIRREHKLPRTPDVVVNAPLMTGVVAPAQTLREVIGLGPDVPLLVYSGAVSVERSVDTVIQALVDLPGIHFVLVVNNPEIPVIRGLLTLAEKLGVADRVHTAPYVPVDQIVSYLSSADVGVHTLLHGPNNEIALATKFYEYAQARLPILVTDVKVMAETTRRTGQGEVFTAGDPADLVRAARLVFGDLARYRRAFDDVELMRSWTWEAQAEILDGVYRRTLQEVDHD